MAYLPNVAVALVVLLVGALLAQFAATLVRGASGTARVGDPDLLATLARAAVLAFAVLIALNQLQIGAAIVNTLFMAVVGMLALAGALAFGLGGRDVAGRLLEDWDARRRVPAAARDDGTTPPPRAYPEPPSPRRVA